MNYQMLFVFLSAGVLLGFFYSRLSRFIPYRMDLQWYKERQEIVAEELNKKPSSLPPHLEKPGPKETIFFCMFGGLSFLASFFLINNENYQAFFFGLFLLSLLLISWIDLKTYLIPDLIVYPLMWSGLLFNLNGMYVPLRESVLGAVVGYLSFWAVAKIFSWLRKREGMGHGDFKLLAALGAWLGWMALPSLVVFAAAAGIFMTLARSMYSRHSVNDPIPFGPSLALSGAVVALLELSLPGGINTIFLK